MSRMQSSSTLNSNGQQDHWTPDGGTFIAIFFGIVTTIGVVFQAIHVVRNWHRA